jgi:hypothetical protein
LKTISSDEKEQFGERITQIGGILVERGKEGKKKAPINIKYGKITRLSFMPEKDFQFKSRVNKINGVSSRDHIRTRGFHDFDLRI